MDRMRRRGENEKGTMRRVRDDRGDDRDEDDGMPRGDGKGRGLGGT
jgi:hypothetical protein